MQLIFLNREARLNVKPGYDGEYGQVLLPVGIKPKEKVSKQKKLF